MNTTKDNTIYIDIDKLGKKQVLLTNSILVVATYNQLPQTATLQFIGRDYRIKEHTVVKEKQTNLPLFVYIAEDIYG